MSTSTTLLLQLALILLSFSDVTQPLLNGQEALALEISSEILNTTDIEKSFGPLAESRCTSPSGSMDSAIVVESPDGELSDLTTVQWQIGLGDKLCYRFQSEEEDTTRGSIEVKFQSVRSIYSIANSYYFKLAKANVDCLCDCPGGGNSCHVNTNSCGSAQNCVNVYSPFDAATGCFFTFLKLSSAMCCAVKITSNAEDSELKAAHSRFRAIELAVPNVVAQFQVVHRDKNFKVVDSRIYNIDLNSGTTVDWEVSLQLSSAGPSAVVPPGWYFAPEKSHQLWGNVPINGLDEWDVHKLGWLKSRRSRDHINTGQQIKQALVTRVHNCRDNLFSYEFSTPFINGQQLRAARSLNTMFPFVQDVHIYRRHVEISHSESPLLVLTLQHRSKVDVLMRFDESRLGDFQGIFFVDSGSNQFLNLSLYDVKGSLHGFVIGYNTTQALQLSTGPEVRSQVDRKVKVTGLVCQKAEVIVWLHPQGQKELALRRQFPCIENNLREFSDVTRRLATTRGHHEAFLDHDRDCFTCVEAWSFWLNPFNWIDSTWSVAGVAVIVISSLVLVTTLCCCFKIACCCCCSSRL